MSTPSVQSLRVLLTQHRPAVSRDGYPPQLQRAAAEFAARLRADGWSDGRIAHELGLSPPTLRRWTKRLVPSVSAFRPVAVVEEAPAATGPSLALVTPGGFRLEGLTVEDAAFLLGRLG